MPDPRAELHRLVAVVVRNAADLVIELRNAGRWVGSHSDLPVVSTYASSLPRISDPSHDESLTDYSSPFGLTKGALTTITYDEVGGFEDLLEFVRSHELIRTRLDAPLSEGVEPEFQERFFRVAVATSVFDVVDYLIHTAGDDFTAEQLADAWNPVAASLFLATLPVEIVVPVALTTFDLTERIPLGENLSLEPISKDLQKARYPRWSATTAPIALPVMQAATHAVVLSNYELPEAVRWNLRSHRRTFYPLDRIEEVFAGLRLGAGVRTGYAQIFARPVGWSWGYKGPVPTVVPGVLVRRYPPDFDDYGWLRTPAVVSKETAAEVGEVLSRMAALPHRLALAVRRFSVAQLREDEDDAALDLCIALEATLGDASPTEMTHKIAMRAATVLAGSPWAEGKLDTTTDVFRLVKAVYGWRSRIVHGGTDMDGAKRKVDGGTGDEALLVTAQLVRAVLRAVLDRPAFYEPAAIDEYVLASIDVRDDGGAGQVGAEPEPEPEP